MEDADIEAAMRPRDGKVPPRIQNFFLIKTKPDPAKFLDFLNQEVLGKYELHETAVAGAYFGIIVMEHAGMILAKLDAGPWPWYDKASEAIIQGIVWRGATRAWVYGWAIDNEWSWIDAWRPHPKTGLPKMIRTVDGPSGLGVTIQSKELWGIDPKAAFEALTKATKWEALRQFMLKPHPKEMVAHVSFTGGKRILSAAEAVSLPEQWKLEFPNRKPEDGPLHLQRYYLDPQIKESMEREKFMTPEEKKRAQSFQTEPPFAGL